MNQNKLKTRLNLNNIQNVGNSKHSSQSSRRIQSARPSTNVSDTLEKPMTSHQSSRQVASKFKSTALYFEVKLKGMMDEFENIHFRDVALITKCFDMMDELGQIFFEFEKVFSMLKEVFTNAIFSDKLTALTSNESQNVIPSDGNSGLVTQRLPFFDFYLKQEKSIFMTETYEKSIRELQKIQNHDDQIKQLSVNLMSENEKVGKLTETVLQLREEVDTLKESKEKERLHLKSIITDLKDKYSSSKELIRWLKRDVKNLRTYKYNLDSVNKDYFAKKKRAQDDVINMFSKHTEGEAIFTLLKQLEVVENHRVNNYSAHFTSTTSVAKSDVKNSYVNDVNIVLNEMYLLNKALETTSKRRNVTIPVNENCVNNQFISPMRDLDGIKFRSVMEIYGAVGDSDEFQLLHRASVTPQFTPYIMDVQPGLTRIKVIHSKYNYTQPHPVVDNSIVEILKLKDLEPLDINTSSTVSLNLFKSTTQLWTEYLRRYKEATPSRPRDLSLSQTRELIYFVYEQQQRLRENNSDSDNVNAIKMEHALYVVLESVFVLPELVMKTAFELLVAIEQYKQKHADVLEFSKAITDNVDPAYGHCLSMVLMLLRTLWLTIADNFTVTLSTADIEKMVKLMYQGVPDTQLRKITDEVLASDPISLELESYSLSKLNKFFIIGFRDLTEHWCQISEESLFDMFRRELISKEDFLSYMHQHFPEESEDELSSRFSLSIASRLGETSEYLNYRSICYIFAEKKWTETMRKISKIQGLEFSPIL